MPPRGPVPGPPPRGPRGCGCGCLPFVLSVLGGVALIFTFI